MSQMLLELIQEQKFDKMWQVLDDVIRNNKYQQTKLRLVDNDKQRCVLGAIMGDDVKYIQSRINRTMKKYNMYYSNRYQFYGSDKDISIKGLKEDYKQKDKLSWNRITHLNDFHNVTFQEFRDLFMEMNV